MGKHRDDRESSEEDSYQRRKRKKKHKSDKKKRKRDYSSDSSQSSEYKRRKRSKKEKKHKKSKKDKKNRTETSSEHSDPKLNRNYALADALVDLLEHHPVMIEDLPLMLVRLVKGVTMDLRQMTDKSASSRIGKVFAALGEFGVMQDGGIWLWQGPDGKRSSSKELFLVQIVRALLDEIGITVQAVQGYENPNAQKPAAETAPKPQADEVPVVVHQTVELLREFNKVSQEGNLAQELAGLCNMILEGESADLDNLPDESLRKALENILVNCGLERSEIENTESDEEEEETSFGYGLPDGENATARSQLAAVIQACKKTAKPNLKGPLPRPQNYVQPVESSDDEEGPVLPGHESAKTVASSLAVGEEAARRSRQLAGVKAGVDAATQKAMKGQNREEWMVLPGKFDFLSNVKSGQPIRSRGFESNSQKKPSAPTKSVDPKIQAQIDAIHKQHEESRGPSLLEQHRERKAQEAAKKAGGADSWSWNREKDLNSGYKVDKNALKMVFGGAGSDLKSKFHSST